MVIPFNAGEILEVAQQIERNGARFYRKAADASSDARLSATLRDLAQMELKHERIFAAMAEELEAGERQESAYDPNGETEQYLRALAGGKVFDLQADPVKWLETPRSMDDILRKAIGLEEASIVYYLGVKEVVPEALGKGGIDKIIREEMKHIRVLADSMSQASA